MNKKLARKFIPIPPILDTDGIKYTPLGKADAFRHSLENSFQVNPEPYCNSHINKQTPKHNTRPKAGDMMRFLQLDLKWMA
ncbi:unnamed protein product [Larinioides sclopetarius]|uniref:Uncharacterized protein n=1 Tax=Larinioides sclopetarius TaxID=280406 RepID=A0AAV1ZTZ7_9ARAC